MSKQGSFNYEEMIQDALRSVVPAVLRRVIKEGLPGNHHFYIAFRTRYPGVSIPKHLSERYPDEMTIVIQHRFWDLQVHPDRFEVGLSFNQRPEHLIIPYGALLGFVDPSVNFALQFQSGDAEAPLPPPEPEPPAPTPAPSEGGGNVVTLDRFRKKS